MHVPPSQLKGHRSPPGQISHLEANRNPPFPHSEYQLVAKLHGFLLLSTCLAPPTPWLRLQVFNNLQSALSLVMRSSAHLPPTQWPLTLLKYRYGYVTSLFEWSHWLSKELSQNAPPSWSLPWPSACRGVGQPSPCPRPTWTQRYYNPDLYCGTESCAFH